jgi:hypothetical protein
LDPQDDFALEILHGLKICLNVGWVSSLEDVEDIEGEASFERMAISIDELFLKDVVEVAVLFEAMVEHFVASDLVDVSSLSHAHDLPCNVLIEDSFREVVIKFLSD